MLPTNLVHTYKGFLFKLSFREKQISKDVITVITSYTDKRGTHSSESTMPPEVYKTVKTDAEIMNKLCDSCLQSNGAVDDTGNSKQSTGAGNG